MEHENTSQFKSRLQAPVTKMPESSKLAEISDAARNARAQSAMAPPTTIPTKRKTLMEQAGEYMRPTPIAPGSKLAPPSFKAGSIPNISRQTSATASTRSLSSNSTRTTSNSSTFSQSFGAGRLPGNQFRPGSSISSYQQASRVPKVENRPASSLETSQEGLMQGNGQGVNSRRPFSSASTMRNSSKSLSIVPPLEIRDAPNQLHVAKRSTNRVHSLREISISTQLGNLSLDDNRSLQKSVKERNGKIENTKRVSDANQIMSPPQIPRRKRTPHATPVKSPSKTPCPATRSPRKKAPPIGGFLTIDSNVKLADWDVNDRLAKMETMYADMKAALNGSTGERDNLKETLALLKARNTELEAEANDLKRSKADLQRTIDDESRSRVSIQSSLDELTRKHLLDLSSLKQDLDDQKRSHSNELDDLVRLRRREVEDLRHDFEEEQKRRDRAHRDELTEQRKRLEDSLECEKEQRRRELNALTSEGAATQQKTEQALSAKDKEVRSLRDHLEQSRAETAFEKEQVANLKTKLSEGSTTIISLESSLRSSKARVEFLESDNKTQSQAFADLEQRTQDAIHAAEVAKAKLRTEETLRRKLHNQVQELKGNIRVYCRVRPDDNTEDKAKIAFPDQTEDAKEVDITGPEEKNSLGKVSTKNHAFQFDRVFSPAAHNNEIFDELSQLVQSALDGYNVCIFAYGQTGAGKTFTMSSPDGMIPRAVGQIYETAIELEEKGWKYSMEGSFVEIYNEHINDLLGHAEDFDKKKHEIRHDQVTLKTTITDVQMIQLDSPDRVRDVLAKAMSNRSVAATMANARSSRSHSVFILKLNGFNAITGEKSEGTLNLVDLAGSERLSHSGATGDRLKETQNINKSLSCLGDVIAALGQGEKGGHIPYRNSKLTYLLQHSLGGNSKTLMFVMISPLQAHLAETLTSLKFATKVHNTHIGTAKQAKQIRNRD